LATSAVLVCGFREIEWEHFRRGVACLYLKKIYLSSLPDGQWPSCSWARKSIFLTCGTRPGLLKYDHLRRYLGDAEYRYPWDKLFSISALLCRVDSGLNIQPDYSRDVEDMYTDAATRVHTQQRNMRLLKSCVLFSRELGIPSWIPDWSTSFPKPRRLVTCWNASAWISADVSIRNRKQLYATGIRTGSIKKLLSPINRDKSTDLLHRFEAV
jgi:hypothetical protein